jgi:hypothetical protein
MVSILEQNLESAIILEDDVDWDIHLKSQLEIIANGSRSIMSSLPSALFPHSHPRHSRLATDAPSSPFGDDWDLLWLGHCGEPFPEMLVENKGLEKENPGRRAMQIRYMIHNDQTVPPVKNLSGLLNFTDFPEHTRWVHVTGAPICSFAYALSQRGARRVLFDLSVDRLSGPVDNALAWLCRRGVGQWSSILKRAEAVEAPFGDLGSGTRRPKPNSDRGDRGLDMKCLSVNPPIFFHHRAKDLVSGDSDIDVGVSKSVRPVGFTENIMWSVRMNLRNLLLGLDPERQF